LRRLSPAGLSVPTAVVLNITPVSSGATIDCTPCPRRFYRFPRWLCLVQPSPLSDTTPVVPGTTAVGTSQTTRFFSAFLPYRQSPLTKDYS
jgi:hypothetical protein